jgi:hypothetical protein
MDHRRELKHSISFIIGLITVQARRTRTHLFHRPLPDLILAQIVDIRRLPSGMSGDLTSD